MKVLIKSISFSPVRLHSHYLDPGFLRAKSTRILIQTLIDNFINTFYKTEFTLLVIVYRKFNLGGMDKSHLVVAVRKDPGMQGVINICAARRVN